MCDQPENKEKKIIIDEDWKSQVEAEKTATEKPATEQQQPAESAEAESASGPDVPLPPPSLTYLASTLFFQGMVSLGLLPDPASEKPQVQLKFAKHAADTLQLLYEKTEGNRTPEETKELDNMLHELRMAYIGVQGQKEE